MKCLDFMYWAIIDHCFNKVVSGKGPSGGRVNRIWSDQNRNRAKFGSCFRGPWEKQWELEGRCCNSRQWRVPFLKNMRIRLGGKVDAEYDTVPIPTYLESWFCQALKRAFYKFGPTHVRGAGVRNVPNSQYPFNDLHWLYGASLPPTAYKNCFSIIKQLFLRMLL